jgi:hypothetical protein
MRKNWVDGFTQASRLRSIASLHCCAEVLLLIEWSLVADLIEPSLVSLLRLVCALFRSRPQRRPDARDHEWPAGVLNCVRMFEFALVFSRLLASRCASLVTVAHNHDAVCGAFRTASFVFYRNGHGWLKSKKSGRRIHSGQSVDYARLLHFTVVQRCCC